MKTFLSFGAGVQTTAMLILIAKGEIESMLNPSEPLYAEVSP